ncbi:MAG: CCA tRNA nucleotidyltransferase [Acidobacteria bacterium]|nr:CCA tRNA nucleotidyltransferase [Acidobacteriota bacterium]
MPAELRIDSPRYETAVRIVRRLRDNGYAALLAGGVVRDALMGRAHEADIDIATAAPPDAVMRLFPRHAAVGVNFGVVIVVEDGHPFEVATFRSDDAYLDGRRPVRVSYTTPEEDAARRDFTLNGLFYDPLEDRLLDFVGGAADIRARVIRAIGNPEDRFAEDHLRILRAIRFAARLDFGIDPATWSAIRNRAGTLTRISRERIRDELVKSLTRPGAGRALRLFLEAGVLAVILPEAAAMAGVNQPEAFHPEGDVFTHTCLMYDHAVYPLTTELALGILLHDVGKPPTYREAADRIRFDGHPETGARMARRILERLKFSRAETETVEALVREHLRFIHVKQMRPSTLKRFLRMSDFGAHLELHRLDCLASHRDLSHHAFCAERLAELGAEALRPPPLLGGDDLIALGLTPGPRFKAILSELEDLQLEGRLTTRDEALDHVRASHLH